MFEPALTILTARTLTLPEWQGAIDRYDPLISIVLDTAQPDAVSGRFRATAGGRAVSFGFTEISVPSIGLTSMQVVGYAHAFTTPGKGDLLSCALGGIAALAYATGAGGAFVSDSSLSGSPPPDLRKLLDGMLAAAFGRLREFEARYPAKPAASPGRRSVEAVRLL